MTTPITVYFNQDERGLIGMSALAIQETLKQEVLSTSTLTKRRGRKPKEENTTDMSTTTVTPGQDTSTKMTIQKTVFDLEKFDDILLKKQVEEPKKPNGIDEIMELLNHNTERLNEIVWIGLKQQARDEASDVMTGFMTTDDEGEITTTPYTGQFADAAKTKLISAAVLSIAKMQGDWANSTKVEKDALRASAKEFLRENPKMLKSLQS